MQIKVWHVAAAAALFMVGIGYARRSGLVAAAADGAGGLDNSLGPGEAVEVSNEAQVDPNIALAFARGDFFDV